MPGAVSVWGSDCSFNADAAEFVRQEGQGRGESWVRSAVEVVPHWSETRTDGRWTQTELPDVSPSDVDRQRVVLASALQVLTKFPTPNLRSSFA